MDNVNVTADLVSTDTSVTVSASTATGGQLLSVTAGAYDVTVVAPGLPVRLKWRIGTSGDWSDLEGGEGFSVTGADSARVYLSKYAPQASSVAVDVTVRTVGGLKAGGASVGGVMGIVSNRCRHPSVINSTYQNYSGFSKQTAMDDIVEIGIVVSAWAGFSGSEAPLGSDATFFCSVEDHLGVRTPLTFSGSLSAVATDGTSISTDLVRLPTKIPRGSKFRIGIAMYSAGGAICITGDTASSAGRGDVCSFGTTAAPVANMTLAGEPAGNGFSWTPMPTLVFGSTSRKSAVLIGTSIMWGSMDVISDGLGVTGIGQRTIAKEVPCVNFAIGGARVGIDKAAGKFNRRLQALSFIDRASIGCIVSDYGTNDLAVGDSGVSVVAAIKALKDLHFPGIPLVQGTCLPRTTNNAANTTNATVQAGRPALNAAILDCNPPFDGFFDHNDVFESAATPGTWADTTLNQDGIHLNQAGGKVVSKNDRALAAVRGVLGNV